MGKIFDMGKNSHLKKPEQVIQLPIEIIETAESINRNHRILELELDKLTSPIFMRMFGSGTQTATQARTSINSRMEIIIEGETRKAEVKLIEYKPT